MDDNENSDNENRTTQNLAKLFTDESVAAARAEIFEMKAKKEGFPKAARLFAAVGESRRMHARRFLRLLRGTVGTTDDNLDEMFGNDARQRLLEAYIEEAEQEGMKIVEHSLEQTLKVEKRISALGQYASADQDATYFVCGVCGFIHVGEEPPDNCPICNAIRSKFKRIVS